MVSVDLVRLNGEQLVRCPTINGLMAINLTIVVDSEILMR